MRRADREITDISAKLAVLDSCRSLTLALVDGGEPYALPMNFGYECADGVLTLYFHSANRGRKLDVLRSNPVAAFSADCEGAVSGAGDVACIYGYTYRSVTGVGRVEFLETHEDKARALNLIMQRQTGRGDFAFSETNTRAVTVFKLVCRVFTGKQNLPKE